MIEIKSKEDYPMEDWFLRFQELQVLCTGDEVAEKYKRWTVATLNLTDTLASDTEFRDMGRDVLRMENGLRLLQIYIVLYYTTLFRKLNWKEEVAGKVELNKNAHSLKILSMQQQNWICSALSASFSLADFFNGELGPAGLVRLQDLYASDESAAAFVAIAAGVLCVGRGQHTFVRIRRIVTEILPRLKTRTLHPNNVYKVILRHMQRNYCRLQLLFGGKYRTKLLPMVSPGNDHSSKYHSIYEELVEEGLQKTNQSELFLCGASAYIKALLEVSEKRKESKNGCLFEALFILQDFVENSRSELQSHVVTRYIRPTSVCSMEEYASFVSHCY